MHKLTTNSSLLEVAGIGPKTFSLLKNNGLVTIQDLLEYYPRTYQYYPLQPLASTLPNHTYTLHLHRQTITSYKKGSLHIIKGKFSDKSGQITIYWFNQPYLLQKIKQQSTYYFQGLITMLHKNKVMSQPSLSPIQPPPLQAIYPQLKTLSSSWFSKTIQRLLTSPSLYLADPLPQEVRDKFNLLNYKQALTYIHMPQNYQQIKQAKHTLSFQELYQLQLNSLKNKQTTNYPNQPLPISTKTLQKFIDSLPFSLTNSQQKAIQIIKEDLSRPFSMNRLLLGDVGSGKTVVAASAAFIAAHNQATTFVLAPTQVLANQLYTTFKQLLAPHHISVDLITSQQKPHQPANVLVGTHALLNLTPPANLKLVIIDEEHKFGVNQKELFNKLTPVHKLSLSATPIPRSLTLTLFSHLNITLLTDKPAQRRPIKTYLVPRQKELAAYKWIKQKIDKDHYQVFFVAPLIEDSSHPQFTHLQSAQHIFTKIKAHFPHHKVGLLHGKLKENVKNELINQFRKKQLHILVATTVIEVGIDIPEANIIVIESAERFGLSQLHQLRGRVGRSHQQGYCLLFLSQPHHKNLARLKKFQSTQDGLELAKFDLQDRGPGEIFGLKQHGFFQLKIANIFDEQLIHQTFQAAKWQLEKQAS